MRLAFRQINVWFEQLQSLDKSQLDLGALFMRVFCALTGFKLQLSIILSMSQYQDFFYSEASREADFSSLQSPYVDEERMDGCKFLMDNKFYKKLVPTQDYPEFTEIPSKDDNPHKIQEQAPILKNRRARRVIHTTEHQKQLRRQIAKGLKDDTTELNINLKTIIHNRLKELCLSRQLGLDDAEIVEAYSKKIASFRAIKKLAKSPRIKQKSLKFIKSPKMAVKILRSHSKFENKLTLLKYVESVGKNFEQEKVTNWKDMALDSDEGNQ